MILVHSGFSVSTWCSGSTRQSQKLRIFSPVKSDSVWVLRTKSKSWRSLLMKWRSFIEIIATIELPYSDQVWQCLSLYKSWNMPKSALFVQSFCFVCKTYSFLFFLCRRLRCVCLSSVVALQPKTILDITTISLKTRFENDARRYPCISVQRGSWSDKHNILILIIEVLCLRSDDAMLLKSRWNIVERKTMTPGNIICTLLVNVFPF